MNTAVEITFISDTDLGSPIAGKKILNQLEEIFFLTANMKVPLVGQEKKIFFDRWLSCYLDSAKFGTDSFCVIAKNKVGTEPGILGYCVGHISTLDFRKENDNVSLSLFQDLHGKFPAHLHINCHPSAQGLGLGTKLIDAAIVHLEALGIAGVHIVTAPDARNRSFYRRLHFSYEEVRTSGSKSFAFMGRLIKIVR